MYMLTKYINMNFTFGIITGGNSDDNINIIIDSIEKQNIPNYEIIIVGNSNIVRDCTRVIPFDESIKQMWITRKKNIITHSANYDNIVYLHDYVYLNDDWYTGHLQFGENYHVCMDKIENGNGRRFRDWVLWDSVDGVIGLMDYDISHLSKYQYISGTYWVAKKQVMEEFPLDEKLLWGEGEDVEWSKQVRSKYNFSMNKYSTVKLLKWKDVVFNYLTEQENEKLRTMNNGCNGL